MIVRTHGRGVCIAACKNRLLGRGSLGRDRRDDASMQVSRHELWPAHDDTNTVSAVKSDEASLVLAGTGRCIHTGLARSRGRSWRTGRGCTAPCAARHPGKHHQPTTSILFSCPALCSGAASQSPLEAAPLAPARERRPHQTRAPRTAVLCRAFLESFPGPGEFPEFVGY